jgi:type II secretory pathway component PulF
MKLFLSLLGPAVLVFVVVIIGGVMVAMILPVLQLNLLVN